MLRGGKNETIVVSVLSARTNFGKLLRRVEDERRSLVIEKRGTPKAVLLGIRDYVRLAAPEAGSAQSHWQGIPAQGHGQTHSAAD